MGIVADVKMYGRFVLGLRRFFRQRVTLEEARTVVRGRVAARDDNFLRMVERGIYGYRRSPYLALLKEARLELGDIRKILRAEGLEATLLELRAAGVYVSFEEFKGRVPLVRGGRDLGIRPEHFDNPHSSRVYEGTTSGSTGPGTRVTIDLDHMAATACNYQLSHEAHGILDDPNALWFGLPPDLSALVSILLGVHAGLVPCAWFYPPLGEGARPALKFRLVTRWLPLLARLSGVRLPDPVPLDLDQAGVLAEWAASRLKARGKCKITCQVSKALRVCLAAQERGLDLTGACFVVVGEPPTPAKARGITATGARFVPTYYFMETGAVGYGCAHPADENDIHVFEDMLALIQYPREIPGGATVESFHFTTLMPTAPKILLNVESDDFGTVERRDCGCLLQEAGLTLHLRGIRSYRKLTAEGVTLVGTDMVHVLETVLPTRFGGSPLDYQLVEEEDAHGFTRLNLLVSPRIGAVEEREVIDVVLRALRESGGSARLAQDDWHRAGTIRVKRAEPLWTARGKFMSIVRSGADEDPRSL